MTKNFLGASNDSLLLILQTDVDFFVSSFPTEIEEGKKIFYYFLMRGKKSEIRTFHKLMQKNFLQHFYLDIRKQMYLIANKIVEEFQKTKKVIFISILFFFLLFFFSFLFQFLLDA